MSWPRFAARPNDNCLSRSACLSLPPALSLSLHLLLLLCVFLSINALLLLLCCPPLTGTYNCLIVNVVVVILENIFLKIFLHIQFLFSFVIHKNSRAEQAPHDDDDTKRCSAGAYGGWGLWWWRRGRAVELPTQLTDKWMPQRAYQLRFLEWGRGRRRQPLSQFRRWRGGMQETALKPARPLHSTVNPPCRSLLCHSTFRLPQHSIPLSTGILTVFIWMNID